MAQQEKTLKKKINELKENPADKVYVIFGVDTTLGILLATTLCKGDGKIILIAKTGDAALEAK